MARDEKPYWSLPVADTLRELKTTAGGLTDAEAEKRRATWGKNIVVSNGIPGAARIFLRQFASPLILLLSAAGVITILLGEYANAIVIFGAVIANTALGFYQEYKAETALAKLKEYVTEHVRAMRNGHERVVDVRELVPGDIINLSQGDRVPADARLIHTSDFLVDESIITGEALPEQKRAEPIAAGTELADRTSMVHAGTLVMEGMATATVSLTGKRTELGVIASLVTVKDEQTPLQKMIGAFAAKGSAVIVALTIVVFGIGIAVGYSVFDMFLTSVAIVVSAIPEGLPMALTVVLAVSVQRLSKRNGVVRKLLAAETLGSVSVILTDKTGTLTEGKMTLGSVLPAANETSAAAQKELLEFALLNSDAVIQNPDEPPRMWRVVGRPLQRALVIAAARKGVLFPSVRDTYAIMEVVPFNPAKKYSAVVVEHKTAPRGVFLGAPDILLRNATRVYGDGPLGVAGRNALMRRLDEMAYRGERVIGVGVKESRAGIADLKEPHGLSFAGFITFHDPVREDAKQAFRTIERAGVRTIIVTGDHRGTAEAVAKELGMVLPYGSVLESADLEKLSDAELNARLDIVRVFARVTPQDKMRVSAAFRARGNVVAMTGDGVNDAPTLAQADIGIAMGSGTDVAKDAADLILLDDNFATIIAAIEEGKRAFANIRKVIVYLFSSVFDELLLIGGALVMGIPLPITPIQILWVNFFSDSFPAIALAFEKRSADISAHPLRVRTSLLDPEAKFLIFIMGAISSALLFGMYVILLRLGMDQEIVRTFMFATFGSYALFLIFSIRDLKQSIFRYNPFSNPTAVAGVGIGLVLLLGAIYAPPLQGLLDTVALPPLWLAAVVAFGAVNILGVEFGKYIFKNAQ